MVVIRWLLLSLFITLSTYAQFDWFDKSKQNYHIYTPITNDAINITSHFATISGRNLRVKSNKFDTLATKKSVQNWLTYSTGDTTEQLVTNGTFGSSTGWTLGTRWSIGSGVLTRASGSPPNTGAYRTDLDTLPNNGLNRYRYSLEITGYTNGSLHIIFNGVIVATLSGDGVKTGSFTRTSFNGTSILQLYTYDGFAGSIDNFEIYRTSDSTQSLSKTFSGLIQNTEYSYYHSIFVRANDGDTDYYQGDTKTFTTASLPVALLLATEDGNYIITEDGNYITF